MVLERGTLHFKGFWINDFTGDVTFNKEERRSRQRVFPLGWHLLPSRPRFSLGVISWENKSLIMPSFAERQLCLLSSFLLCSLPPRWNNNKFPALRRRLRPPQKSIPCPSIRTLPGSPPFPLPPPLLSTLYPEGLPSRAMRSATVR